MNSEKPGVSVIIPVYNVEKWLPACLDSVLNQTYSDLEVICIDDHTPDGSGKILDEYAAVDGRMRVFHLPENHMQGYGRNLGLREARGKYVYFLDSDDMITPEAIKELYALCEEQKLDGVFFDSQAVFDSEELEKRCGGYPAMRKGNYPETVCEGPDLLDMFTEQGEYLVYVQREFWNREFLTKNGIENIIHMEHEDEFFTFQAILTAKRLRYVRKPYFIRRYREDSVMTRPPKPRDFHGYFVTYNRMAAFAEEHGMQDRPGVMDCLLHMWDCVQTFSAVFDGEDPEKWFSAEEQGLYRLYRTILASQKMVKERDELVLKPLLDYRGIEIYGAGRIARSIHRRLMSMGIRVTGFFVTDPKNDPEELLGMPVKGIGSYTTQEPGTVILVAMAKQWHEEIAKKLDEKGLRYFLYARNVLEGPFGPGADR